jgi:hypothetical protein
MTTWTPRAHHALNVRPSGPKQPSSSGKEDSPRNYVLSGEDWTPDGPERLEKARESSRVLAEWNAQHATPSVRPRARNVWTELAEDLRRSARGGW